MLQAVMCSIGEATDVPLMDAQYPRDAATERSAPACAAAQQHLREKVSIATDDVSHPRSTREKSKYTSVRVCAVLGRLLFTASVAISLPLQPSLSIPWRSSL